MIKITDKKAYKMVTPAIASLKVALDTVKTNEPINRQEGNIDQANLERTNAKSYRMAIKSLKDLSVR